jgi:uncharacterized damage-inducible protein DinB
MTAKRRPDPSEYAPYYERYVKLVETADVLDALRVQIRESLALLRGVSAEASLARYAPGKWSVRELVGHVTDSERIFAYRALRFGRGDETPLAGFEQDDYIPAAHFDRRPWSDLLGELEAVRRTSVQLFEGFDEEAWSRKGTASGNGMTVRALAYVIAGHERHHMGVLRSKYLKG